MTPTIYPDLFQWGGYSRTPDAFGDTKPNEVWADGGRLRGRIDGTVANAETRFEATRATQTTTISVRQYVLGIKPLDRLTDVEWDEVWTVVSVRRGDNEMVIDAIRKPPDE